MASDDVREIKSRLDIVDVISERVKLKRNGQTWWGCCPFHNEKTPSFSVSPQRQTFHCFGCGKGGDIFTFVMESEHLEFREALERLAERAGVTLTKQSAGIVRKKTATDINRAALDYFIDSFGRPGGEAARGYMERRNMSAEACRRFEIGWAPNSWDGLIRYLEKKGFAESAVAESGLASQGRDGRSYDRFRGRVIFPIYNVASRLIGFGGRILDGDGAKYLNSPESSVFNKRHNLYLLDKAKSAMNERGSAILVEGYMDAIRAHLCGYTNTVASLGTALTQEQASLIKRMTGICYVCYDADSAGQEASLRSMYLLQAEGVEAKRVVWNGGKDPDEILQLPDGRGLFEKSIAAALPLPIFHVKLRSADLNDPSKAQEARRELLDGLSSLSAFDLTPCIDEIAATIGVYPHEVKAMIDGHSRHGEDGGSAGGSFVSEARGEYDAEYMFCSLLWNRPELRAQFRTDEAVCCISQLAVQNIVYGLMNGEEPDEMERRWRQMNDASGMAIIARGNGLLAREGLGDERAVQLMDTLRRNNLKRRLSLLSEKIKNRSINDCEYEEFLRLTRLLKGGNTKA